jgi:alkylation response protein AidB-like acyl-CoA dehydrogenase
MVVTSTRTELAELREVCQRFLGDRHPITLLDGDAPGQRALWDELAAMGWAATLIPEAAGGMGWGWEEAGVVAEELGRSLAPVPFLSNALVAPNGLRTITHPPVDAAMAAVARGDARVAVAGLPAQRGRDGVIDVEGGPAGERLRGTCSPSPMPAQRLADLYVLLQGTTAIVEAAVRQLASADASAAPHPALGSLAYAYAYAADAYVRIAGDAVLVHGAIGFTWEHDLHRYLKRAMLNRQLAGTTSAHRDRHLSIKLAAMGGDR